MFSLFLLPFSILPKRSTASYENSLKDLTFPLKLAPVQPLSFLFVEQLIEKEAIKNTTAVLANNSVLHL